MNGTRFLLDENVRGLARWLRFLGFDTRVADPGTPDLRLKEQALQENRILVTRDRELARSLSSEKSIGLASDETENQMRTILERVGKTAKETWFQLCSVCNEPLETLSEAELENDPRIPAFVKTSKDPEVHLAWTCPRCHRAFWRGSHFERTQQHLHNL